MSEATFTPEQAAAIADTHARIAVVAGAGSGKTKTIVERTVRVLQRTPPERVLLITFSRDAAGEIRERLAERRGEWASHRLPEIRTLHAWCARLLRTFAHLVGRTRDFTIYDEVDYNDVVMGIAADLGVKGTKLKTVLKDERVRREVERRLQVGNALTFDDVQRLAHGIMQGPVVLGARPYSHVMVDETQDLDQTQAEIIERLAPVGGETHLFVVGDHRQAIYGFRGGDSAILRGWCDSPVWHRHYLPDNFRSVPLIVEIANRIAGPDEPMRSALDYDLTRAVSRYPAGPAMDGFLQFNACETEHDERLCVGAHVADLVGSGVPPHHIAVLARTWAEVSEMGGAILRHNVPVLDYGSMGSDPWKTPTGRAVARMVLLHGNPTDDNLTGLLATSLDMVSGTPSFLTRMGLMKARADAMRHRCSLLDHLQTLTVDFDMVGRKVAPVDLPIFQCWRDMLTDVGLTSRLATLDTCLQTIAISYPTVEEFAEWWTDRGVLETARASAQTGVHLLTMHSSKGLEFPHVLVVGAADDAFSREDDRCLLYVAATRAKYSLEVSFSRSRKQIGRAPDTGRTLSRFLPDVMSIPSDVRVIDGTY